MARARRDVAKERGWRDVLARRVASGLSVRAFCRRAGLCEASFYAWRRTIRERDGKQAPPMQAPLWKARALQGRLAKAPAFVPAMISGESRCDAAIVIELAGGRRLKLPEAMDASRVAELVHALETRGAR